MKLILSLLFIFGGYFKVDDKVERKIISDDYYNYTFFVSNKTVGTYNLDKKYFWFKSGGVHSSIGGANGNLLQGLYTKSFRKNGIAEQGVFQKGLKHKKWKTWYENGIVKEVKNWKNGIVSGRYISFAENGALLESGRYQNNYKSGKWIKHVDRDTLFYRKGKLVVKAADTIVRKKKIPNTKLEKFWDSSSTSIKEFFRKKTPAEKKALKKKRIQKRKINADKKKVVKKKVVTKSTAIK